MVSLLREEELDDNQRGRLCNHFNFELFEALQANSGVAIRLTLVQSTGKTLTSLVSQDPKNSDWQRDLSVSHAAIGTALGKQGNLAGALNAYQASLGIAERLAALDPRNSDWQRDLSVRHAAIGDVLLTEGNLAGALNAYQASLGIAERLAALDPRNSDWQRDLSVSHRRIGSVLLRLGKRHDARTNYETACGIAQRLVSSQPENPEFRLLADETWGSVIVTKLSPPLVRLGLVAGVYGLFQGALLLVRISRWWWIVGAPMMALSALGCVLVVLPTLERSRRFDWLFLRYQAQIKSALLRAHSAQIGQSFRSKPATDSDGIRPGVGAKRRWSFFINLRPH